MKLGWIRDTPNIHVYITSIPSFLILQLFEMKTTPLTNGWKQLLNGTEQEINFKGFEILCWRVHVEIWRKCLKMILYSD